MRRKREKPTRRSVRMIILTAMVFFGIAASPWTQADDSSQYRSIAAIRAAAALDGVEVSKDYALGISRFNLDGHTEILGWRLNGAWYLGRQDGLDSGLTLVWQQDVNQVSFSKDGLRLTRRF